MSPHSEAMWKNLSTVNPRLDRYIMAVCSARANSYKSPGAAGIIFTKAARDYVKESLTNKQSPRASCSTHQPTSRSDSDMDISDDETATANIQSLESCCMAEADGIGLSSSGSTTEMSPSIHLEMYSLWCSLCKDGNPTLLFCAGCRSTICAQSRDEPGTACLESHSDFSREEFIFLCPACCRRKKRPFKYNFVDRRPTSVKKLSAFRFDPPILFISLVHEGCESNIPSLISSLLMGNYVGNEASLHFLNIKMGGRPQGKAELTRLHKESELFLEAHPLATIFVVIDSIVSEDGQIVHWTTKENFYYSDWVVGVLKSRLSPSLWGQICFEGEVIPRLENPHRCIMLNINGGKQVATDLSRRWLVSGHRFEFVLSLTSEDSSSTRVGELPPMFVNILTTSLAIGVVAASHMTPEYAKTHMPVFSGRTFDHVVIISSDVLFPNGKRLVCPGGCDASLRVTRRRNKAKSKKSVVQCGSCYRQVTVTLKRVKYEIPESAKDFIFGVPVIGYVQTPYPIPIATEYNWSIKPGKVKAEPPATKPAPSSGFGASLQFKISNEPTSPAKLLPASGNTPPAPSQTQEREPITTSLINAKVLSIVSPTEFAYPEVSHAATSESHLVNADIIIADVGAPSHADSSSATGEQNMRARVQGPPTNAIKRTYGQRDKPWKPTDKATSGPPRTTALSPGHPTAPATEGAVVGPYSISDVSPTGPAKGRTITFEDIVRQMSKGTMRVFQRKLALERSGGKG